MAQYSRRKGTSAKSEAHNGYGRRGIKQVCVELRPDLVEQVDIDARANQRSRSGQLRHVIDSWYNAPGHSSGAGPGHAVAKSGPSHTKDGAA